MRDHVADPKERMRDQRRTSDGRGQGRAIIQNVHAIHVVCCISGATKMGRHHLGKARGIR
jgi:hypothetical protein